MRLLSAVRLSRSIELTYMHMCMHPVEPWLIDRSSTCTWFPSLTAERIFSISLNDDAAGKTATERSESRSKRRRPTGTR
jgi:hypothetical protein